MFYVGVDLGKTRDHTAFAVVERGLQRSCDLRGLERVPLGSSYPYVVERLGALVRELGRCCLVVDGTGVGAAVVDLMRRARMGCEICEVTITGGEHASAGAVGGKWNVPKQDLLTEVQVLLEQGELRIAKRMREAGTLARELGDVRAVKRRTGRVRMGADGCGQHDDLVIALALACWRAKRGGEWVWGGEIAGDVGAPVEVGGDEISVTGIFRSTALCRR